MDLGGDRGSEGPRELPGGLRAMGGSREEELGEVGRAGACQGEVGVWGNLEVGLSLMVEGQGGL